RVAVCRFVHFSSCRMGTSWARVRPLGSGNVLDRLDLDEKASAVGFFVDVMKNPTIETLHIVGNGQVLMNGAVKIGVQFEDKLAALAKKEDVVIFARRGRMTQERLQ